VNKFVYVKDNVLSEKDCDNIIKICDKDLLSADDLGYEYYDIKKIDLWKFLVDKSNLIIKDYLKIYPELNLVSNPFALSNVRFKKFNKGKSFGSWHSEHCIDYPHKILNVMYYLSNHNCGTKFYDGEVVLSKKGRAIVFPSYFTHTHKGEICPDNKTRYILTGYFEFIK
tara:strand:+ start:469 stop:975 length:507 start_codon:yes stop_codon:yes gene_type:complete